MNTEDARSHGVPTNRIRGHDGDEGIRARKSYDRSGKWCVRVAVPHDSGYRADRLISALTSGRSLRGNHRHEREDKCAPNLSSHEPRPRLTIGSTNTCSAACGVSRTRLPPTFTTNAPSNGSCSTNSIAVPGVTPISRK